MTLHIPDWFAPLAATVAIWLAVMLAPIAPARGDYDFTPSIRAVGRLVLAVVTTLVVWLVYCIINLVLRG